MRLWRKSREPLPLQSWWISFCQKISLRNGRYRRRRPNCFHRPLSGARTPSILTQKESDVLCTVFFYWFFRWIMPRRGCILVGWSSELQMNIKDRRRPLWSWISFVPAHPHHLPSTRNLLASWNVGRGQIPWWREPRTWSWSLDHWITSPGQAPSRGRTLPIVPRCVLWDSLYLLFSLWNFSCMHPNFRFRCTKFLHIYVTCFLAGKNVFFY